MRADSFTKFLDFGIVFVEYVFSITLFVSSTLLDSNNL